MPRDARAEILAQFESHRLVALAEEHGSERQHAFLRSLLRSPLLPEVVDDVVVEFGSARYQATMNAYVAGAAVSRQALARAWRETTQREAWSSPVYAAFFRTAREVNAELPAGRRLRVLLGDPPVEWERVGSDADLDPWIGRRNRHFAGVVEREVLDRGRKALLVAGAHHLFHGHSGNETALLRRCAPEGVYVVLLESRAWPGLLRLPPFPADAEPRLQRLAAGPADAYLCLGGAP